MSIQSLSTTSGMRHNGLRNRIAILALITVGLFALTALSLSRLYIGAQQAQSDIALAMRQVSEVTWRVKNLEMWLRVATAGPIAADPASPTGNVPGNDPGHDPGHDHRALAFAYGDAMAMNGIDHLDSVLGDRSLKALARISRALQARVDDLKTPATAMEQNRMLNDVAILVKDVGNLNFETIANLLTNNRRILSQGFMVTAAASISSLLMLLLLWRSQHRLVQQKQESERTELELLGAMASGFAHTTQNVLWSLRESLKSVAAVPELDKNHRQHISRAIGDINELSALNSSLTNAAQGRSTYIEQKPLREIFDVVLRRDDPDIVIDPGHMQPENTDQPAPFSALIYIISELIGNARDAIRLVPDGHINFAFRDRRSVLEFQISDTGTGMTTTVQTNCLKPFFTTKDNADGHCGFGLHAINRMIASRGGTMTIHSAEGRGTDIIFTIPKARL